MTKILIDSNVLVWALDTSAMEKHNIAKNQISKLTDSQEAVISIQNLAEFSRVSTEKLQPKADHEIVKQTVSRFKILFGLIYYNADSINDALTISTFHKVHFFDALIAATMKQHQITHILTENETDFAKIPGIKVVNPFKKK